MKLFFAQFKILLWKCWILKKRHYVATFFEFFLPLLTSITMVLTVSSFKPDKIKSAKIDSGYHNGPTIYNYTAFDLNDNLNKFNAVKFDFYYLIAPDGYCTDRFLNEFDKELRSRIIGPPNNNLHYLKFKSKEELDLHYSIVKDSNTSIVVGILFNNECTENYTDFLKYFSFTIKTLAPETPNIATLFPDNKRNAGPSKSDFYLSFGGMTGFIETQNLVNLVYLNQVKSVQTTQKNFKISNVQAFKYPYPSYIDRPPATLIDFLPSVLIYGFIILFPIVVKRQASESYNRQREMFKLMNLNDWAYFGSTFVHYLIELFFQTLLLTFLYCFRFNGSTAVFNYSSSFLVFCIIFMYGVNLILLAILISIPFKRPIVAVIASLIVYVLTDTLHYFIDPKYNKAINSNYINTIQLVSCLLPNSSINFVMRVLSILELYSSGGDFSNLFETTYQYGSLSVGVILAINFVSAFMYSILIWYLDAVWPFQYGIIKPWYFPLNPLLKLFNVKESNEQTIDQTTTNDLKYFEEEKTKNKVKISIKNLTKKFGKRTVVSNINLNLHENHLIALLGHNGAGKTTLMNMVTGLFKATSGKVLIDNYNIQQNPKKARTSLSLCPQHNVLYDELTAYEHLMIYGTIKGKSTKQELELEIDDLLEKFQLKSKKHIQSGGYSGGMKRKLNLAIALIGQSKIVILDEPTSGMDPESRRMVWDVLLKEKRKRTILLTTHFIEESDVLGDRIFIMSAGKSRCYGTPVFLKRIFGMGYQLRIAKDPKYNSSSESRIKLKDFIRQYFKNSSIMNENVGELIYSLDNGEEDVQDSVFPDFFKNFEQLKDELNISTFGVTSVTLEDVFLKVLNMSNNEMSESRNQISVSSGYDSSYNLTGISLNTSVYSESVVPFLEDTSQNNKIKNKFMLLRQRFNALLIKRLNHSKRYYPMIIFQVIIPIVIFWLILYLDAYLRPSWRDEQSFVMENELYGETSGFFKDNSGDEDLFKSYNSTSSNSFMKTKRLNWDDDPNQYLLNISSQVTISTYIKNQLYGAVVRVLPATEEKGANNFNLEVWYNNEASHSLPLSTAAIYNSLLDYIDDSKTKTEYHKVKLINEPFPNNFAFATKFLIINGLKVMWSLLVSLSLPFLAASYSLFPIHEYVTKSKLLQKMAGTTGYLYWFSTFVYDVFTHSIVCALILMIFFWQDKNDIFVAFNESLIGLFSLLFVFGLASMQTSYSFSRLLNSIGTGFLVIVVFNLIFGVILAVIDFLFVFLVSTKFITQNTYDVIMWLFRMFPIYSLSRGVSNLYIDGSKGHLCDHLSPRYLDNNCPRMPILRGCCPKICKDDCFVFKTPFVWNSDGILMEIFSMSLVFLIAFIVNLAIEENLIKKILALIPEKNQANSNVLLISNNRVERYLENSSEDSDVIQEKRRVETLVEQTNKNNLPQSMLVHHLTKLFDKFIAVDDLSFALDERECFGLLGVNGAGKTTTFKMLVGDLEPTEGTAFIKDFNLKSDSNLFQQNIGYCPQFDALLDNLTGEEMLYLFGRLRGIKEQNLKYTVDCIVRMIDLTEHSKFVCSNYSGGNKRKLSLGMALIGLPKIIFLDEPTSGIDAEARRKIWKTLVTVKEKFNCSIVLTSHSMDECEALCSRVAIMVAGKFKCLNSVQNLRQKYGRGYTLTMKLKTDPRIEERTYLDKLKESIRSIFPSAILKDFHESILTYQIVDNSLKWSFLFSEMEKVKADFDLEYYLLSDCTLEQIFLNFAKTSELT